MPVFGLRGTGYTFEGLKKYISYHNSPLVSQQSPYPVKSRIDGTKIRVLEIEPGCPPEPLRCTLVEASLDTESTLTYAAISYEWGASVAFVTILINGTPFGVRPNLWTFLMRIRLPNDRIVVWADAVCINQQDITERNVQVSIMDKIYSQASHVLVWLGPKESVIWTTVQSLTKTFADSGIDFAEVLLGDVDLQDSQGTSDSSRKSIAAHDLLAYICRCQNTLFRRQIVDLCKSVLELCQRSYWSRTWTIQELVLARSKKLCIGSRDMPWRLFEMLCAMVQTFAIRHGSGMDQSSREKMALAGVNIQDDSISWDEDEEPVISKCGLLIVSPAMTLQHYVRKDLSELLTYSIKTECFDRRDKVYALLGLASNRAELPTPDYSKDRVNLLLEVVACYPRATVQMASALRFAFKLTTNELLSASTSQCSEQDYCDRLIFCAEVVATIHRGKPCAGTPSPLSFVLLYVPNKERFFARHDHAGADLRPFSLRKDNTGYMFAILDGYASPGDAVYRLPYSTVHIVLSRLEGQHIDSVCADIVGRLYSIDTVHKYPLPLSRHSAYAVEVHLQYDEAKNEGSLFLMARFGKQLLLEAADVAKGDD